MKRIIISENNLKTLIFDCVSQYYLNESNVLNNSNKNQYTSGIYVLVACEESQAITKEFRKQGIEAYSCDLQDCSGGHPEWHIKGDCLLLLNGDNYTFRTIDGQEHFVPHWNLIMSHPTCTYLTTSGNRWFNVDKYGDKAIERQNKRAEAIEFFMKFTKCDADHISIENPIGIMSSEYRKPDQIIQPWMWGDKDVKTTCLWNKNLPKLEPEYTEKPEDIEYKEWVDKDGKKKRQSMASYSAIGRASDDRQRVRSKTYPGIARAIATQWGNLLKREKENRS